MSSRSSSRLFYGWINVLCGALILGVSHGVVTNCFSLYIIPVSQDLGVSREAFSFIALIVNVLYAMVSFLSGRLFERFRVIALIRAASVVLPLSYFCFSLCTGLPSFYLCAVVVGLSVSLITFLPFTLIISNWFIRHRGRALGLCFMGSGLGGMVMNFLSSALIEGLGWRSSYQLIALIMAAVMVPLSFLVIRATPQEMHLRPLGGDDDEGTLLFGPLASQAIPTISFAMLVLLSLIVGFASTVYGNVINPHLRDLGFSPLYASSVLSLYLGALAAAKILLGALFDRIGARRGTVVSMLGFILGFLGIFLGKALWSVPLILLGGLGTASSNVSYPVLTRFAFGTRDFTRLNGLLMGMNYVTCSIGTVCANLIYSATGSYNAVLFLCMGLCALVIAILPLIRPVSRTQ